MVRRLQSYYRILPYLVILIIPKLSIAEAKPDVAPLLVYTGNLRVLNIDLETLDAKEPIISQLIQSVEDDLEKHPKYSEENNFVLGYLSQLQDKDERAHRYFQEISEDHPLYSTMLFFDGRVLRKIGEKSSSKSAQKKNCKQSMDSFSKVNDLSPNYFRTQQAKEMMLSTFCYFHALVDDKKLDTQESQWLQNTLESSTGLIDSSTRENLYFQYYDSLVKSESSKEELEVYLVLGFSLFPKNARLFEEAQKIQMPIPEMEKEKAVIGKTELAAQEIFNRGKELLSKSQPKQALQEWLKVIVQYPGSYTSADTKQEIMAMIKNEAKWNRSTAPFNEELKKLPPEMMFDIAKYLWNQDYNITAYDLYQHIIEKYPYFEKASEAYFSMANMHENWSEWPKAIKYYLELVQKYSSSKFFERAHFKVGFLYYMNGQYTEAVNWLAKEKNLVTDAHQKAQACYWLGRTYEKMKKKRDAQAQFDEIRSKFPLTYYSFILGIDPTAIQKTQVQFQHLTIESSHPLYLPSMFLGIGLHRPARQMIQEYGNQSEEHLYQIVQLFHDAGFHMYSMPNALDLAQRRIEKWGLEEELVKMIFPVKFLDVVKKESASQQTDPLIALSLMKQESGYFERAVSNANAIGLMQLLVPTAQTLAKKMNEPSPNKDDLFDPSKNVRLGIRYLTDLNLQFNNDVTLVLSAYNAGPERAVKWKKRWPNVKKDEFVELIPFPETRKYVKLILRNYSYYEFLIDNKSPNIQAFGF